MLGELPQKKCRTKKAASLGDPKKCQNQKMQENYVLYVRADLAEVVCVSP